MDQAFAESYRERKGLKEGLAKGEIIGANKNKIEIAKKMLSKNMSIDDIIELTSLSKEQVLQLSKQV